MALQTQLIEDLKRAAWSRTTPVGGQPSAWEFRKDCFGNVLRYADYGNRHSPFGWELEYITARALGASTDPDNLQALHWKANAGRPQPQVQLQTVAESQFARRR